MGISFLLFYYEYSNSPVTFFPYFPLYIYLNSSLTQQLVLIQHGPTIAPATLQTRCATFQHVSILTVFQTFVPWICSIPSSYIVRTILQSTWTPKKPEKLSDWLKMIPWGLAYLPGKGKALCSSCMEKDLTLIQWDVVHQSSLRLLK